MERTAEIIQMTLPAQYAEHIEPGVTALGDVELLTMTVSAPLPLVGLLGPGTAIQVTGRAVRE